MEVRRALARVGLSLDDETGAAAGAAGPAAGPAVPLGLAVGAYLEAVRAGGRSPETVRVYRTVLRAFLGWAAGARPGATCADLGHALADAFVRHLREEHRARPGGAPLADRTVHQYVTVLKIFARWGARGRRYWPVSPLADYEAPAFIEREIVPSRARELAALLAACGADTTFVGAAAAGDAPRRPGHRPAPGRAAQGGRCRCSTRRRARSGCPRRSPRRAGDPHGAPPARRPGGRAGVAGGPRHAARRRGRTGPAVLHAGRAPR